MVIKEKTIPEGYKETEIGVIPENWKVKLLNEVATITMGQSPESKYYNKSGVGLPLVQGNADVENRRTIVRQYTSQITKVSTKGDIIMSVRAPVGNISKNMHDCCIGRGVCAISSEDDFLFYYLIFIENSWSKLSKGSTFDSISSNEVKDVKIPYPPKNERIFIANALSNLDLLISSTQNLLDKKLMIKHGTMQQLLTGTKRLKGFDEDWRKVKLKDFVTITSGESPSKMKFTDEGIGIPYFKVDQLNLDNKYQVNTPYFIEGSKKVERGSLIFPKRGASILLNKLRILNQDSFMDTNLMTLTISPEIYNEFLYYYLLKIELWRIADTTSIPQINNKHINSLEILLPTYNEQVAIAQILSDMDTEIDLLEQKLGKYKLIKQGMLQELLTGKRRLE